MNGGIRISHAKKCYGNNVIIPDLSLEIKEGEFFTLLGPSGCGKTTLLRMIAGFNTIEDGDFYFGDTRINNLDPAKRNIGMVFQNYAIFPNMSVKQNVAFGLKNRKLPKNVIEERCDRFLKIMKIEEMKDRMPDRLSGGQQQRVALARALSIEPAVLLMDEPLSNLDAKLRIEMREAIKEMQNELGITTVYVTHDQEEAMAISDRIAVMNLGVIQQIGTPKELYLRPRNQFVANFVGTSNFLYATVKEENGKKILVFDNGYELEMRNLTEEAKDGLRVMAAVRPEEFIIHKEPTKFAVTVHQSSFLGLNTHYFAHLDDGTNIQVVHESEFNDRTGIGSKLYLTMNAAKINVLSEDGSHTLIAEETSDNA